MLKILNIYFSAAAFEYGKYEPIDDCHFFESEKWKARPNSTDKLNIANHVALEKLKSKFLITDINSSFFEKEDHEIKSELSKYNLIIIHQAPGLKWIKQLSSLIANIRELEIKPRVIFGTELTWMSPSVREVISDNDLEWIFCNNTVLRHTPKTDRFAYFSEKFSSRNIVEFDLGIDTKFFNYGDLISERKYITFVRAPEGRVTKNNDDIDNIISHLKDSELLKKFEIKTLTPPYSTVEFKDLMAKSFAFVMTSDSETFSYCLNEAKSMGTICFYPSHMYCTKFGAKFAVDNYPHSFGRYSSYIDLQEQLEELAESIELSLKASHLNRTHILENFSLEKLSNNWLDLINNTVHTQSIYIFDRTANGLTDSQLLDRCKSLDVRFAMPIYNNDPLCWKDEYFTSLSLSNEVAIIKYFITQKNGSLFRSFYDNERKMPRFGLGAPINKVSELEVKEYASLITRIYSLGRIVADYSLKEDKLLIELSKIKNITITYV